MPKVHMVAKLDVCAAFTEDNRFQGNPYVITHIPVGLYPTETASYDKWVAVLNSQDESISIIDSEIDVVVKTTKFDEIINHIYAKTEALWLVIQNGRKIIKMAPKVAGDWRTLEKKDEFKLPAAADANCAGRYSKPQAADIPVTLSYDPIPGKIAAIDENATKLAVSNIAGECFFILDSTQSDASKQFAAFHVNGATSLAAASLDGRWLYLAKRFRPKVAVFDLENTVYTDANADYPTHKGAPVLEEYDIETLGAAKGIAFLMAHKAPGIKRRPDVSLGEEEDPDGVVTEAAENPGLHQFAFIATFKGVMHTIDLYNELHKPYDDLRWKDAPNDPPRLYQHYQDPQTPPIKGGASDESSKFDEASFSFTRHATGDADYSMTFNGILPNSDSVSGRFDFANGRLYDPNVDFTKLDIVLPGPNNLGDRLAIKSAPSGKCPVTPATNNLVSIEISGVGYGSGDDNIHYITFNKGSLPDLSSCFDTSVEYEIRANENYLVFVTDSYRSLANAYLGRAYPKLIKKTSQCLKEDLNDPFSFASDAVSFVVCKVVEKPENGLERPFGLLEPPKVFDYSFSTLSEIDVENLVGTAFEGISAMPVSDGLIFIVDTGADKIIRYSPSELTAYSIQ